MTKVSSLVMTSLFAPVVRTFGVLLMACALPQAASADMEHLLQRLSKSDTVPVIVELDRPADFDAQALYEQRTAVRDAASRVGAAMREVGIEQAAALETLPFMITRVNRDQLMALAAREDVVAIFENRFERKGQLFEGGNLNSSAPSIGAPEVWAAGYDGSGYAVAVIDGGFNTNHPAFAGKVIGEACFSTDEFPDTTSECRNGVLEDTSIGASNNCTDASRCDHGTHVAATAAGDTETRDGIARGANLVLIDVFSAVDDPEACGEDEPVPCQLTDSGTILRALDYVNQVASQYSIASVNMSLGGGEYTAACQNDPRTSIVNTLTARGVAVVASSGNDGFSDQINAPACVPNVISVGSTNDTGDVSDFSNMASFMDLVAPGENIVAAGSSSGLIQASGTSMASPHVAGAMAVLRQASPASTVAELKQALIDTGTQVSRADLGFSIPRINLNQAVRQLVTGRGTALNNVFTTAQNSGSRSFLRFYNQGLEPGTVDIEVIRTTTGRVIRTWTSPEIPPKASLQFGVGRIDQALASDPTLAVVPTYYNMRVVSTFDGYMQHVVFNSVEAGFSDLSSCTGGASSDATSLTNVHTSQLAGYSSFIRILNDGLVENTATLSIYDSETGDFLFDWTSEPIPPNGSIEVAVNDLETDSVFNPLAVSDELVHYNVELNDGFDGLIQHVVRNFRGVVSDLSRKCALVAGG